MAGGSTNYHYVLRTPTYSGLYYNLIDYVWTPVDLKINIKGEEQECLAVLAESICYECRDSLSQTITRDNYSSVTDYTTVTMYTPTSDQRDYTMRRLRSVFPTLEVTAYDGETVMAITGRTGSAIDYTTSLTEREAV